MRYLGTVANFAFALTTLTFAVGDGATAEVTTPLPPCSTLPAQRVAPPAGTQLALIKLPRSVDPAGCVLRVERGARIFKTYPQRIEYTAPGPHGSPGTYVYVLEDMAYSYSRTAAALTIRMADGRILEFPASASIVPSDQGSFRLTVVKSGDPTPTDRFGVPLRPVYIVP